MIRDGEHSVTVIAEAHGKVISEFQKKTYFSLLQRQELEH